MTEPLTPDELAAIEKRCDAATRGPWRYRGGPIISGKPHDQVKYIVADRALHPDGEFIAHSREDLPRLLAEVKRLRAWLEWLRTCGEFESAHEERHLRPHLDAALSGEQPPK